jgi:dienelactone hydrolase
MSRTEDREEFDDRPRRRPPIRKGWSTGQILAGVFGCGTLLMLSCAGGIAGLVWWFISPTSFPEQTEDYADARKKFQTRLLRPGPAPQAWDKDEPPDGVEEVNYTSGGLKLKAWTNEVPAVGPPRPAVLFLHGGFAFGEEDWDMVQPYLNAGFAVMIPLLRGENGQPGSYSMFFHEVDDVLAAANVLAARPGVNPNRLFVAGHSVGGTLAMLAAMTSNRFKAAASFSGSPDQVSWARGQEELVPFDTRDNREFAIRSPLAYPRSFKCPARLYYGSEELLFSRPTNRLAEKATAAGADVQAVEIDGDHNTSVPAAMRHSIAFFRSK